VIPVAVGANVVAINYPDGCTLPTTLATNGNVPGTGNQDARLKVPVAELEKAFGAATTTWGGLVPGISETPGGGRPAGSCAAQQMKRVVRFDDSGTTFAQKAWLNAVNPTRMWLGNPLGSTPNTTWPLSNGTNGKPKAIASGACDAELCSAASNGNGSLVSLLAQSDGAIGYSDIRTARQGGFELNPTSAANANDTTYWIPIQNQNNSAYNEPTSDPNSFKPGANPGANCLNAVFSDIPADTTGDFSKATAANSPSGYSICVATYILAWDDYAKVYGTSDTEQREARTVKDYLEMILGPVAQAGLAARDYQALPQGLLALAQGGVSMVNFNKGGGGDTPPPPPPTASPSPAPTSSATPAPTTPPAPNNVFTIDSARVTKSKVISLTLQLPGSGAIAASAIAASKGFRVGSAAGNATAAGSLSLQIKPSRATIRALKKIPRNKKLKVNVAVSFTPTGGTASTQNIDVSLKGTKKKKKRKN